MDDTPEQSGRDGGGVDLEEVWRQREEDVYPRLFGPVSRGIFPLEHDDFAIFGVGDPDPRWLHHGVIEFAPTEARKSWLYVTSGYSNPWHVDPADYAPEGNSGSGVEFILETDRKGDWAIVHLRRMLVLELLLASGRIGNGPLGLYDRIPLKEPIDWVDGHAVRNLMTVKSAWPDFSLPSGGVMFVQLIGLTDAEIDFAKKTGAPELLKKLDVAGVMPVIVPDRACVL